MIIIWGSQLYGKTDEIPGLCHVATRFGHLWYIPLIPMASFIVFSKGDNGFNGASIPLNAKSVLIAYLRGGCAVGAILCSIAALANFDKPPAAGGLVAAALFCVAVMVLSYKLSFFKTASYQRAMTMADHVGFTAEARLLIDEIYQQIAPEEVAMGNLSQRNLSQHEFPMDPPQRTFDRFE